MYGIHNDIALDRSLHVRKEPIYHKVHRKNFETEINNTFSFKVP